MTELDADRSLGIIKHHLSIGNIAAVAPLVEQLADVFHSDDRFQNLLAEVEARQGKLDAAIARYLLVLRRDPINFTANLKLFAFMSALEDAACASVYDRWTDVTAGGEGPRDAEDRLVAAYGAHDSAYELFLGMSLVAVRQQRFARAVELFGSCLTEADKRTPMAETVEAKYAVMVEGYDGILFHEESVERVLGFTERCSPARVGTVIDAACGTGLAAPRLRRHADRLIGLDLSPDMLTHAEARGLYSELLCGDMVELMGTRLVGVADEIICIGATYYLDDLGAFLAGAAAALKPGGQLFFSDFPAPPGMGQLVSRHATFRYCRSLDFIERQARDRGLRLGEAVVSTVFSLPSHFLQFIKD